MKRVLVLIDERQIGIEGAAIDTVSAALGAAGVAARVIDDGLVTECGAPMSPLLSAPSRQKLVDELTAIGTSAEAVQDLIEEAFRYGRTGFHQMSDAELCACADLWSVNPRNYGFSRWPGAELPPVWRYRAPAGRPMSPPLRAAVIERITDSMLEDLQRHRSELLHILQHGCTGLMVMSDAGLRGIADRWSVDVDALAQASANSGRVDAVTAGPVPQGV